MDYRFIKGTRPRLFGSFSTVQVATRNQCSFSANSWIQKLLSFPWMEVWGQGRKRRFFAPLIDGQLDLVDV